MKSLATACLVIAPLLFSTPVRAEEDPTAEVVPAPIQAIEGVLAKKVQNWSCEVARQKRSSAGMGGNTIIMGGGPSLEPFLGAFDAQVRADALVVASRRALPGFVLLSDADRVLQRITVEHRSFDLGSFRRDVLAMLDVSRAKKWLQRTTWTQDAASPGTWRGDVPRRFLPSPPASNPVMPPQKNLAIRAIVTLDDKGALTSLRLEVDRDDPQAAMRKRLLSAQGGMIEIPGGGGVPLGGGGEEDRDDAKAKVSETVTYTLQPAKEAAKRVVAGEKALRADLAEDGK